jgi:acetyl-CoA acetyltransferase
MAALWRSVIRSARAARVFSRRCSYALEQRQLRRGIATLCLGGGNGVAVAVERI